MSYFELNELKFNNFSDLNRLHSVERAEKPKNPTNSGKNNLAKKSSIYLFKSKIHTKLKVTESINSIIVHQKRLIILIHNRN